MAGELQLLAGLPPSVHCRDYVWMKRLVELCFEFHSSGCGFQKDPVAIFDFLSTGAARMDFQFWVWNRAAESWDVAMLFVAEMDVSEKSQREWVLIARELSRFELRQW